MLVAGRRAAFVLFLAAVLGGAHARRARQPQRAELEPAASALVELAATGSSDPVAYALQWEKAATSGSAPSARKGHTATVVGGKVYVFGGSAEPAHTCFDELYVLDLKSMKWSRPEIVGTRPPPLTGHAAVHVAVQADGALETVDYIYVLGGFSFSQQSSGTESSTWSNAMWILNTRELTWERAEFRGSPMSPRQGHTATVVNREIYVFGGYSDSGVADATVLSLGVERDEADGKFGWAVVRVHGPEPSSRMGHVTGLLASRYLVVFGGFVGVGGQSLADVHVLDLASESEGEGFAWSVPVVRGPDYKPVAREDMDAVVLPGRTQLALFGGCSYPSKQCHQDVAVLSVEAGQWSWSRTKVVGGEAPSPREEHAMVVVPREGDELEGRTSEVLVIGGGHLDTETFAGTYTLRLEARNTTCPEGCSGHGTCDLGECECDEGFFGPLCARFCADNCNGHGACEEGECSCEPGWTGDACDEHKCPKGCSGHGECDVEGGSCACEEGYFGDACAKTCDPACGEHGKCTEELTCECADGWQGETCTEAVRCPHDCSGHGECDTSSGKCACAFGFRGAGCNKLTCPDDCSGNGHCEDHGECTCEEGWDGENCAVEMHHAEKRCPADCSGHGTCDRESLNCTCIEDGGKVYYGADCGQWTYFTVQLNFTKGPCTPNGVLTVPSHNRNFTLVMVRVTNEAGVPEDVPCPVPAAPEVQLTTVYRYRPVGVDEDVEVVVPLRVQGSKLVFVPPDAPVVKLEVSAPVGSRSIALPTSAVAGLQVGSSIVLSLGTEREETAVIKAIRDATGSAMQFRRVAATVSAQEAQSEYEFVEPLQYEHPSPLEVSVAEVAPPPQQLPSVEPPPEPLRCDCDDNGGRCVPGPFGAVCECYQGFGGRRCDIATCPSNCTSVDNGRCEKTEQGEWRCRCQYGYSGDACAEFTGCGDLGRGCGEHAWCETKSVLVERFGEERSHTYGFCHCYRGFAGPLCNVITCPNNCTGTAHGECVSAGRVESCRCKLGWKGEACSEPDPCPQDCSGHGACSSADPEAVGRHCICQLGWSGAMCAEPVAIPTRPCPADCTHETHGVCHDGTCVCRRGFTGATCADVVPCLRDCSGQGTCDHGTCVCDPGFEGVDCGVLSRCPHDCSRRGRCVLGSCVCAEGFTGHDCSKVRACPAHCSGHGACELGKCTCDVGFSGTDCSVNHGIRCNMDCHDRGTCHFGRCFCEPGFAGDSCELEQPCPAGPDPRHPESQEPTPCHGSGVCRFGRCFCAPGYQGEDCSLARDCPLGVRGVVCSGRGYCSNSTCFCAPGFHGFACERGSQCPANCSSNGFCFNGKCMCDLGFAGEDCSLPVPCPGATDQAPQGCAGNGKCLRGRCYCAPGFGGVDCTEVAVCPANCSLHGRCVSGACLCDPGWQNDDCSQQVPCPDRCNARGTCVLGTCACHPGFAGVACELRMPCPSDCSGHGECVQGECMCDGSFYGSDCSRGGGEALPCPNNCSDHGVCSHGQCSCHPGWTGRSCREEVLCPRNCSGHGMCSHGTCFCDPGYEGRSCVMQVVCPADCSNRGTCVHGRCFCNPGWASANCSETAGQHADGQEAQACPTNSENLECAGNGVCEHGICRCSAGWYGAACDSSVRVGECPNRCSGHGVCVEDSGVCLCVPGFTGEDCSEMSIANLAAQVAECDAACSRGHGQCDAHGKCVCEDNWQGENCDEPICPNACTVGPDGVANGMCTNGRCVCNPGFGGEDCALECPNRCSGRGTCQKPLGATTDDLFHCYCEPGYTGNDCSEIAVKRTGMSMTSLIGIAMATFLVGLCAIPLAKTYVEKNEMKRRMQIIHGPQNMDDILNPLNMAQQHGVGSA